MKRQIIPDCHAAQIKLSYVPRRAMTYIHRARPTYDYLMQIWDKELIRLQGQYVAVFLNSDRLVLGWQCLCTNSYKHRKIDTGLVIALAATTRAQYVIIAHNNPNGDLINEKEDNDQYHIMKELCRHLGCELQDQMIISTQGYYSYGENEYVFL